MDMGSQWRLRLRMSRLVYVAVIALALACLLQAHLAAHIPRPFDEDSAINVTDGWMYRDADGMESVVDLDHALPPNEGEAVRISRRLPVQEGDGAPCLALYLASVSVKVYVDGDLCADSTDHHVGRWTYNKSDGYYWYFVNLPPDYAKSTVELLISSPYPSNLIIFGQLYLGTRSSLLTHIVHENLFGLAISSLLLITGLTTSTFYSVFMQGERKTPAFYYLGAMEAFLGSYLLGRTCLAQAFTDNPMLTDCLLYVSVMMGTICSCMYVITSLENRWYKINFALFVALTTTFCAMVVLQLTGIADFYETIWAYHVVMVVYAVAVAYELVTIVVREHNHAFLDVLVIMSAVCAYSGLEIIFFYIEPAQTLDSGKVLIVTAFALVIFTCQIREMLISRENATAIERYKKLAQTDTLTGLGNRSALIEWFVVREMQDAKDTASTCAVVIDVDGLKTINDHLGHDQGDIAITTIGRCAEHAFGRLGICCRTGGDEFTCMVTLGSEGPTMAQLVEAFQESVRYEDGHLPFELSASCGYSAFDPESDRSVRDAIKRADEAMYREKRAKGKARM